MFAAVVEVLVEDAPVGAFHRSDQREWPKSPLSLSPLSALNWVQHVLTVEKVHGLACLEVVLVSSVADLCLASVELHDVDAAGVDLWWQLIVDLRLDLVNLCCLP